MQRDAAAAAHHPAPVPPARIHHCKRAAGDALHCKQPPWAALSALLPSPRPTFAWGQPCGDAASGPAAKDRNKGWEHIVLASPQENPQPLSSPLPTQPTVLQPALITITSFFPSLKLLGLRSLNRTLGRVTHRSVISATGPLSQQGFVLSPHFGICFDPQPRAFRWAPISWAPPLQTQSTGMQGEGGESVLPTPTLRPHSQHRPLGDRQMPQTSHTPLSPPGGHNTPPPPSLGAMHHRTACGAHKAKPTPSSTPRCSPDGLWRCVGPRGRAVLRGGGGGGFRPRTS